MGSRGKDPFNFDDIYRKAGVEDLFVKKTMGEMKTKVPDPTPVSQAPAAQPARPAQYVPASTLATAGAKKPGKPSSYASQYANQKNSLDFFGGINDAPSTQSPQPSQPPPAPAPPKPQQAASRLPPAPPLSQQQAPARAPPPPAKSQQSYFQSLSSQSDIFGSSAAAAATASLQDDGVIDFGRPMVQSKSEPMIASSSQMSFPDDAFAVFSTVEGASQPVSRQPTPQGSTTNLQGLFFDDAPAPFFTESTASHPHDAPFFDVDPPSHNAATSRQPSAQPAPPAVLIAPSQPTIGASATAPAAPPPSTSTYFDTFHDDSGFTLSPAAQQQQQQQRAPPPPPPSYEQATSWNKFEPPNTAAAAAPPPATRGDTSAARRTVSVPLRDGGSSSRARSTSPVSGSSQRQQAQPAAAAAATAAAPADAGAAAQPKGIAGMLVGFGKRAMKAAATAKQHLEEALEKVDQRLPSQQAAGRGYEQASLMDEAAGGVQPWASPPAGQRGHRRRGSEADASDVREGSFVDPDEVMARAVSLADMPPNMRNQELAKLPEAMRLRVSAILQEQHLMTSDDARHLGGTGGSGADGFSPTAHASEAELHDAALARALSLADMPPNTRALELAKLPATIRSRVTAILQEQELAASDDVRHLKHSTEPPQPRTSAGQWLSTDSPPSAAAAAASAPFGSSQQQQQQYHQQQAQQYQQSQRPQQQQQQQYHQQQPQQQQQDLLWSPAAPAAAVPPGPSFLRHLAQSGELVVTREFRLDDSDDDYAPPPQPHPAPVPPPAATAATDNAQWDGGLLDGGPTAPHHNPASAFPPAPAPPASAAAHQMFDSHDLLGLDGSSAAPAAPFGGPGLSEFGSDMFPQTAAAPAAAAAPTARAPSTSGSVTPPDLLFDAAPSQVPAARTSMPAGDTNTFDDDFFSGGAPAPAAAAGGRAAAASSKASAAVNSYDLSGLDPGSAPSAHAGLYTDDGDAAVEGEPEIRRQLRAQRLAERETRMKEALAEKLAKDDAEAARREEQVNFKEQYKEKITTWRNKNKGNIRAMLGSLQTVLWEGHTWTTISVGDLLEPNQVKKAYMKANLLVHPDKVRQRNGTAEQVAVADMVFDALKEGWSQFK